MRYSLLIPLGLGLLALAQAGDAGGGKEPAMLQLWPDNKDAGIFVHMPPAEKANGAAVVICPGGGYGGLAIDHEGKQIAEWLNGHGVAAFMIYYMV